MNGWRWGATSGERGIGANGSSISSGRPDGRRRAAPWWKIRAACPKALPPARPGEQMEWIVQILVHTPWWVYALFAYLVSRGVRAFRPADVSLYQLALIPALLTGWGLYDLTQRYGLEIGTLAPWLAALAIGVAIGLALLRGAPLAGDRARGIVHRPADYTLL